MRVSDQQFPIPDLIGGLVATIGELFADLGPDPALGSRSEAQMNSDPWSSGVKNAFSQASLLIEISSEHLLSFKRTITEVVLPTASWASVRGVLETSALSAWLLDPEVGPSVRAARSYALRYEGLIQQKKFVRSLGDDTGLAQVTERVQQVLEEATSQGHNLLRSKSGKLYGLGTRLPPITELAATELRAESEYRLLSAMLHGHHWATQSLSFVSVPERGKIFLEKNVSPVTILYLAKLSVRYFAIPLRRKFDLYGWDRETLDGRLYEDLSRIQDLFAERHAAS
jgi:hypothetical protein